jgi:hypothetical protein
MSLTIIHSREQSTLASSWEEHLCLRRLKHGLYELSLRRWEFLGEYGDYADEDGELPETIDGKAVASVEDGYICGGDLVFASEDDEDVVRFRDANSPFVAAWLQSKHWRSSEVLTLLLSAVAGAA